MWSFESQFAAVECQDEVAIGCDLQIFRTLEIEGNLVGIGAGGDLEVILQAALPAVKIQINPRIKIAILHSGKLRDIAPPAGRIVSDNVVTVARQRVIAGKLGGLICAAELHLYHGADLALGVLRQGKYGLAGSQIKAVAVSVGEESNATVALALVRLETKRQTTEGRPDLLRIAKRGGRVSTLGRAWASDVAPEQERAAEEQQCKDDWCPSARENLPHPTAIDHHEPSEFPVSFKKKRRY